MATRVRRGELALPDDDDLADKYLLAEELLSGAGYQAYEVSNWAARARRRCRHNLGYWRGDDWWGVGPGAHSHVGGTRWWNVKHPAAYAARLAAGPVTGAGPRGALGRRPGTRAGAAGDPVGGGDAAGSAVDRGRARVDALAARSLVTVTDDRLRLTLNGRLLADAVVRELVD